MVIGVFPLGVGLSDLRRAPACSAEPQSVTLRELLAGAAGTNPHVAVTDFRLCHRYVTGAYKDRAGRWISDIGIVPADTNENERLLPPRAIVVPRGAKEETYLVENWRERPALVGMLGDPDRLPDWDRQSIQKVYPGIALKSCLILHEGLDAPTTRQGWTLIAIGGALFALGLGLFVCTIRRPSPRQSSL